MAEWMAWGDDVLTVELEWSATTAPRLAALRAGCVNLEVAAGQPLWETITVDHGHTPASGRLVGTAVGQSARHVGHRMIEDAGWLRLDLELFDELSRLGATLHLARPVGVPVICASVTVSNRGSRASILRSVASFASSLGACLDQSDPGRWVLHRGRNDWLGEGRWRHQVLDPTVFPDLAEQLTGHPPRGALSATSTGTWSTGRELPVAALSSAELGVTWAWQIEHNGGWQWQLGQGLEDGYLALAGPSDLDHQWTRELEVGQSFTTVPVTVTVAADLTSAIGELTRYRRAARRHHEDNTAMPVVFNDYMNTLNGDPTTAKLLPLIDAAAAVGAEVFCIDAGWYDDGGDWWDSVGEWRPSRTRFPGGLAGVLERIRRHDMVPGLWLEPEVVGIKSPTAAVLPDDAFLQRGGQRIVEHDRFHLDLRHPAARAHLDEVVDRLVEGFGVGFFKLDYNIDPGPGSDRTGSIGDGLLDHNRAHLAWLDGVLTRHPQVILENCGSGAMRSDFSMTSRVQLQSTSDQQDFLKYPAITASAPMVMLPEQAASWAYPQPEMSLEEVAFTLTTGLAGRIYLSGYLNRMSSQQLQLVTEAVLLAKQLRTVLPSALPFWPLGLPRWDEAWVVLGLAADDADYLMVWNRDTQAASVTVPIRETGAEFHQIFPISLAGWRLSNSAEGLLIHNPTSTIGARILRRRRRS